MDIHSEYQKRINKVQDYIETHLDDDLTVDILADVSGFSKFHFSRIFRGMMKETLLCYINRIRLERASSLLLHNPMMSITQIATELGYSDSAVFARSYKKHYGMSASEARQQFSKHGKVDSKNGKANIFIPSYNDEAMTFRKENVSVEKPSVELRVIEEIRAIYVRHKGTYKQLAASFPVSLKKLFHLAQVKKMMHPDQSRPFVIYHDHPAFTEEEHLHTSICLSVSQKGKEHDPFGYITIPSRDYAIFHFTLKAHEYHYAWDYMYSEWLPQSGLQPDQGAVFEVYQNDPATHPEKKSKIDIYLPIKSL
ncbi:AraC family transcriptional regulator [Longirhabdus pacifica]|uniref:AraC family transcriptional regulator n=1 Tax=Longirhabdus pacifica TaxID=2305227 RepID=UPI001008B076|nr:AraC family transcriptional regulator [Longirhabdus pacifica]